MKIQKFALLGVLGFAALFHAPAAHAWGDIGHRTVGEIADRLLTPVARAAIQKLMGGEPISTSAVYPDEMRSNPDFNFATGWHFLEVAPGTKYDPSKAPPGGDADSKIEEMKKILTGAIPEPTYQAGPQSHPIKITQQIAFRYLVHLIGDIHQPLHTGNGVDHGANNDVVYYFDHATSLHEVWDTELIESTKLSFTELATEVLGTREQTAPGLTLDQLGAGTTADWVQESLDVRPSVYPIVNTADPSELHQPYSITQPNYTVEQIQAADVIKKKANKHSYADVLDQLISAGIVKAESIPNLSYQYKFDMGPLLHRCLLKGGVRLAAVLNEIFGGATTIGAPAGGSQPPCEKNLKI